MTRYACRRDANETPLIATAERLGGHFLRAPPLDGWLWVPRLGRWLPPVEVKLPAREGHAHEFTPTQARFFQWCEQRSAPWLVWRTEDDVLRTLNGGSPA